MKEFLVDPHHPRRPDVERAMADIWPRVEHGNVRTVDDYPNAKRAVVRLRDVKLTVILEVEVVDDQLWAHLSVGGGAVRRVPSWEELGWCKTYFLGDRRAIQVLPPAAEYINLHPHVLHLYAPLGHNPIPDFRGVDETGRLGI